MQGVDASHQATGLTKDYDARGNCTWNEYDHLRKAAYKAQHANQHMTVI
jgi:hypothetical protein